MRRNGDISQCAFEPTPIFTLNINIIRLSRIRAKPTPGRFVPDPDVIGCRRCVRQDLT